MFLISFRHREKISDVLDLIDNRRLSELQDEKVEFVEYQGLNRKRRAMEYTLCDKDLCRAREQLDKLNMLDQMTD
ncbi:MAG: hypothetical protein ACREOZ_05045 [Gloeomargaritales cyanobacterium]